MTEPLPTHIPLKYKLFAKRRFLPIFLAQFLGAFNDNLLRSGLIVLIAYASERGIALPIPSQVMVTICSALLVVPFILFSSIAGPLADKYEKSRLVVCTKIAEVGIMLVAFYGFSGDHIYLLMAMLFVSGTHSTFFGPIKYSILPDHLKEGELLAGNGFIAAGSYLGILSGLIAGGLLALLPGNIIGYAAVGVALCGLIAALFVPKAHTTNPDMHITWHPVKGTMELINIVRSRKSLLVSVMGLSWFLLVGSVFMAQFPNYAKHVLRANNEVYTLFLTLFSVGIALGSVLCDRLLKGEITARLAPFALVGVSALTLLMVIFTPAPQHEGLIGFLDFVKDNAHWPMLVCMLLVAVCGGVYMVPLYAILQHRADASQRSRVIAASNVFDSLFMTIMAIVCAALLYAGLRVTDLFLIMAVTNGFVALYFFKHTRSGTLA